MVQKTMGRETRLEGEVIAVDTSVWNDTDRNWAQLHHDSTINFSLSKAQHAQSAAIRLT
jgi:hypothetical protein